MVCLCFNVFWLAKTILLGTVKGKRKSGRQKRWEDNIKEWTGMDFASIACNIRSNAVLKKFGITLCYHTPVVSGGGRGDGGENFPADA